MITALVIALSSFTVYGFLAVVKHDLAVELGVPYGAVIVTAWLILSRLVRHAR